MLDFLLPAHSCLACVYMGHFRTPVGLFTTRCSFLCFYLYRGVVRSERVSFVSAKQREVLRLVERVNNIKRRTDR